MEEKKYIQLEDNGYALRLYVKTKDGKETGEYLEFDLADVELLENLQKMADEDKKNNEWFRNQLTIISKKQDFTKKGHIMSNNKEMEYQVAKEYFKKQKEIYELFLGKDGVDKLLYGRKFEWTTMIEIENIIKNQIAPQLEKSKVDIIDKVKNKYKIDVDKNVLE